MNNGGAARRWLSSFRRLGLSEGAAAFQVAHPVWTPPRIGLALGGGFARGIAHAGVLRVLERHNIPIHCIGGVSAGSIVAAAFASGTEAEQIRKVGCSMRFADVARWTICRMGFAGSERMETFLRRLLQTFRFEEMKIPLGVLATDVLNGEPVFFHSSGDVCVPVRASCSYPGLFRPVEREGRLLVDGAMSMEVPADPLKQVLGATHVISVHLAMQADDVLPRNVFQVVNRCFQIMQRRSESDWRKASDLVLEPAVSDMDWDAFHCAEKLVESGERAAEAALPVIRKWLTPPDPLKAPMNGVGSCWPAAQCG